VSLRPLFTNARDGFGAVRLPILIKFIDERFAKLVARALRAIRRAWELGFTLDQIRTFARPERTRAGVYGRN